MYEYKNRNNFRSIWLFLVTKLILTRVLFLVFNNFSGKQLQIVKARFTYYLNEQLFFNSLVL